MNDILATIENAAKRLQDMNTQHEQQSLIGIHVAFNQLDRDKIQEVLATKGLMLNYQNIIVKKSRSK